MGEKKRGRPEANTEFGGLLRRARQTLGLTQDTACALAGCSQTTWSNWEIGVTRPEEESDVVELQTALLEKLEERRAKLRPNDAEELRASLLREDLRAAWLRDRLGPSPGGSQGAGTGREGAHGEDEVRQREHWRKAVRGSAFDNAVYFTGRKRAINDVVTFVSTRASGLCVVTGMPGAGKSALLGFIVLASDRAEIVAHLPAQELVHESVVDAALTCRGLDAARTILELARQLNLDLVDPTGAEASLELIERMKELDRPSIVFDSLDEADDPAEIADLAFRLSLRTTVVVGTRRSPSDEDDSEGLPRALRRAQAVIDLDGPPWLENDDVVAYLEHRLKDDRRADGYTTKPSRTLAQQVRRVAVDAARAARGNFLIAQYIAEDLLAEPPVRAFRDDWTQDRRWPARLEDWVERDLRNRLRADFDDSINLLAPLAFARKGGMPLKVWEAAADALAARPVARGDIAKLIDLVGFYLSKIGDGFALRHEAFAQYFRARTQWLDVEGILTDVLLRQVPRDDDDRLLWESADPYARRNLARHAHEAGRFGDIAREHLGLLAAADPQDLLPPVTSLLVQGPHATAETYRRAAYSLGWETFDGRCAYLEFHAFALGYEPLGRSFGALATASWRTAWRTGASGVLVPNFAVPGGDVVELEIPEIGRVLGIYGVEIGTLFDVESGSFLTGYMELPNVSPEGEVVGASGRDGEAVVVSVRPDADFAEVLHIDVSEVRSLGRLHHDSPVARLCRLPTLGSDLIATGGTDGQILLWGLDDLPSDGPLKRLAIEGGVSHLLTSSSVVAAGSDHGMLKIWRLNEDAVETVLLETVLPAPIEHMVRPALPGDLLFVKVSDEACLRVYGSLDDGKSLECVHRHPFPARVRELLALPRNELGGSFLVTLAEAVSEVWGLGDGVAPRKIAAIEHSHLVESSATVPFQDSIVIAVTDWYGFVSVWRVDGGAVKPALITRFRHGDKIRRLRGIDFRLPQLMTSSWGDEVVKGWTVDPRTLQRASALQSEETIDRMEVVVATSGNVVAALLDSGNTLRVLHPPYKPETRVPADSSGEIADLMLWTSEEGTLLATARQDEGVVDIWSLQDFPTPLGSVEHDDLARTMTPVPGLETPAFAVGTWDGTVYAWSRVDDDWASLGPPRDHGASVVRALSAVDRSLGPLLVTSDEEVGNLCVWALRNQDEDVPVRTFPLSAPVDAVAVTASTFGDVLIIAGGGEEGTILLERANPEASVPSIRVQHGAPVRHLVPIRQQSSALCFLSVSTTSLKLWDVSRPDDPGMSEMTTDVAIGHVMALDDPEQTADGLIVTSVDGEMIVWPPGSGVEDEPLRLNLNAPIAELRWLPSLRWLVATDGSDVFAIELTSGMGVASPRTA